MLARLLGRNGLRKERWINQLGYGLDIIKQLNPLISFFDVDNILIGRNYQFDDVKSYKT